jgi:hypothetical protein
MTVRGRVHNGVVVLEDGAHFSEGQEVTVVGHETASAAPPLEGAQPHSILDIPTISLGAMLCAEAVADDLLGEMLDGRL